MISEVKENVRRIVWFSCGAASAITAWLVLKEYPDAMLVYCDTGGEHGDNVRFMLDVERWLGKEVVVLKSKEYRDHFDVIEKTRYVNGRSGARCTVELKKKLRFGFQRVDDIQHFGYTTEKRERARAERFREYFPEVNARFPLIERRLTKKQCVGLLQKNGVEIPAMYKLGYNNNNCIGCVKGGAGYWNKIRKDFPEHFERMKRAERSVGHSCINGTFLDELKPGAGRHTDLVIECDFICESTEPIQELRKLAI